MTGPRTGWAIAYARVSKEESAFRQLSIAVQLEQLERLAQHLGLRIHKSFTDEGVSGSLPINKRPGFQKLIEECKRKPRGLTHVLCMDVSRFSRYPQDYENYVHLIRNILGLNLIFSDLPDQTSEYYEIYEREEAHEARKHALRSKVKGLRGMEHKVLSGYRAGGRAPWGYQLKRINERTDHRGRTYHDTVLEPHPENFALAQEYFRRRAAGESKNSIARDFNSRGAATPAGRYFSAAFFSSIESRMEAYLGHTVWKRLNERVRGMEGLIYRGGMKYRPQDQWVIVTNTHPPCLDQATADRIVALKGRSGSQKWYRHGARYLFSMFARCGECHAPMVAHSGYYVCRTRDKAHSARKVGIKRSSCTNPKISARKLESAILTLFVDWLDDALWELSDRDDVAEIRQNLQLAKEMLIEADHNTLKRFLPKVVHEVRVYNKGNRERPVELELNYLERVIGLASPTGFEPVLPA